MEKENVLTTVFTVILVSLIGLAVFFNGCIDTSVKQDQLQRYSSYGELVASFSEAATTSRDWGYDEISIGMPVPAAEKMATGAVGIGGVEYSTTNIQVEGVDEADIIKTDGKYAYAVSGKKLYIIEAFPAEDARIASTIEFESESARPRELFISGDKMLVFVEEYGYYRGCPEYEAEGIEERCFGYYGSLSAMLYNIEDRENPVLEKELEFEGNYLNSRLIGSTAYFIVSSNPRYPIYEINPVEVTKPEQGENIIPLMKVDGVEARVAEAEMIGFVPGVLPYNFITIVSLNLESQEMKKEVVTATGQTIYASQNSLYITAPIWGTREKPIPLGAEGSIFIPNWDSIGKTSISKFSLSDGEIDFVAEGIVPGNILNQFSMDEFDGHFRIATTVGHVSRTGSESKNNVYVLDGEMDVVGTLEDLAPGEKIYSARFMGEKCYIVTFKKVDPLFVIDLSVHTNPRVLGKLKIPGYSDYLHPIDETHILGLGKETIEATKGDFAWYQGIKMAIFDVSDPTNPIEMDKIVIGDRGTESYALHDHRAFLFDKKRELLVIPITLAEIPEEQKKPLGEEIVSPSYGEYVFQGAFVFNLSLEDGISERGRITHVTEEDELKRGYYYSSDYSVKRAFYIEDMLYTFSDRMLKANNLESLEEIKEVDFGPVESDYYGYE